MNFSLMIFYRLSYHCMTLKSIHKSSSLKRTSLNLEIRFVQGLALASLVPCLLKTFLKLVSASFAVFYNLNKISKITLALEFTGAPFPASTNLTWEALLSLKAVANLLKIQTTVPPKTLNFGWPI